MGRSFPGHSSLLLHILNTWLVLALGRWKIIGWRMAALAAGFFAIYEGHQEAVVWYSALPELLVFFFVLLCIFAWIRWAQSGRKLLWFVAALVCFVLALVSKESAVVVTPLLVLVLLTEYPGCWDRVAWVSPFAALCLGYFWLIFSTRSHHLHFHDAGTFSLAAPFWFTWSRSYVRLFWVWGFISIAALVLWRESKRIPLLGVAAAWIGITLLPYSFLTYMNRVPSRHTYFASVGLGLVIAAGFLSFQERSVGRRWAGWALAAIIVAHQCAYLWTRKQAQFLERAAPTEALLEFAKRVRGPIYVHCFPYDASVAQLAVELQLGKEVYMLGASDNPLTRPNVFCPGGHLRPQRNEN